MKLNSYAARPTEGRIYYNPVIGDKVVFLETCAQTGGAYTLIEVEVVPAGGPSLHAHRTYSETFIQVEGELQVQVGKEERILKPGDSWTVPAKTLHRFRNLSNKPVRFQVKLVPGNEGFENSVKLACGLAQEGLTNREGMPKNLSHAAVLLGFFDPHPTGILRLMMPFFRWKARQARKRGIEAELMDRYCR
jgi:mannose-6-phosphate isomerase-like protein (cupin superfamily)